jgi:hypothetical protein
MFEASPARPARRDVRAYRVRRRLFGAVLTMWAVCVSAAPARAAIVHDLFRVGLSAGAVPPADPAPLLARAARAVLRRLGLRLAAEQTSPAVRAILGDPRHWIAEYGYTRSSLNGGFRIWVRFDARDLMHTLLDGGLPVWGRERPRVLCLIAIPGASGRRLLGTTTLLPLEMSFEHEARRRGLPVVLPIVDLADLRLLQPGVLATTPLTTLVPELRRRYAFDALVVGNLRSLGSGRWSGRFRLWSGGGVREGWTSRSETTRRSVLHHLVRRLARLFAVRDALLPGGTNRSLRVRVAGLKRLSAVVSVGRLLGRVLGVRKLALEEVTARGSAVWSLETRLPLTRLARILTLSDRLVALPSVASSDRPTLRFRYRP